MKNFTKITNTFFFFFIILFLLSFGSLYADTVSSQHNSHEEQKAKPKLSFAERAIHAISTTRESYKSSWLKIKDHLHELRMKLSSPDLEHPMEVNPKKAAEKINEGVKTSSQTGMDASEGWAKSAAEEVGNAAHKTTDKLKVSDKEESKSEL